MRTLYITLTFCLLNVFAFANNGLESSKDSSTLIVGVKTSSYEGFGKFYVFRTEGDTLIAFSADNLIKPGMYMVSATNKNEYYHKRIWVVDPRLEMVLDTREQVAFLAIVVGISDEESYCKIKVNKIDPSYLYGSDPSSRMDPGTYFIVGSNNQDLYHQKLIIRD